MYIYTHFHADRHKTHKPTKNGMNESKNTKMVVVMVSYDTASKAMNVSHEKLRREIGGVVYEALTQICGGGLCTAATVHDSSDQPQDDADPPDTGDERLELLLRNLALSSVSFPNKNNESVNGKPHDIEVRAASSLFCKCVGRKRKRPSHVKKGVRSELLKAVSDFGLVRFFKSPSDLARVLCRPLEEMCRRDGLSHDIRSNEAGIICIVTPRRAQRLRQSGRLPCSMCVKWCKGEKGLWWHQQREHGSEHSIAAAAAASERSVLAIVPYTPRPTEDWDFEPASVGADAVSDMRKKGSDVFEFVRQGDLSQLRHAIQNGVDPRSTLDRNGASLLLWAAGKGHLDATRYLVEICHCDANQRQKGKRAFSGRAALHWAARNGHLDTVRYLIDSCGVDIDAQTGDGTTAFCWASWQGHLSVMQFLRDRGCDVHRTNSFGCNAVLWCAQGGNSLETMQWLYSVGCDFALVNSNGHGTLHKVAQRNQDTAMEWLTSSVYRKSDGTDAVHFGLIGPDADGCCPSDLAGMEGHTALACRLVEEEKHLTCRLYKELMTDSHTVEGFSRTERVPSWISSPSTGAYVASSICWEPFAGARRMNQSIQAKIHECKPGY